jgi:hypothetical protein
LFQKLGNTEVIGFDSEMEIGVGFASKREARMGFGQCNSNWKLCKTLRNEFPPKSLLLLKK